MKISFSKTAPEGAAPVFLVGLDGVWPDSARLFDRKMGGGALDRAVRARGAAFAGKSGECVPVTLPEGSGPAGAFVFGCGEAVGTVESESLGGKMFGPLCGAGGGRVAIHVAGARAAEQAASLAAGLRLQSYRFDKYKTKTSGKKSPSEPQIESATFVLEEAAQAEKLWRAQSLAVEGTLYARDLVNEPPNVLYPDSFARRLKDDLEPLGVGVEIFDDKKLRSMGMTAMLAVGQGSPVHPPRLVVLRWNGGGKVPAKGKKRADGPLAFVGKGLTFDAGGLNLKPTGGIETMKLDMAGAAAVAGLFRTVALRKAKVDAVGVLGLVENAISGSAYRPSDIITGLSGKTIEILNTDAEGRVVLSDCLTYVQRTFAPRLVIDLATLTGAMMVALGNEYCGTFCNTDALWESLAQASADSGEKLWRMPLDPQWRKDCESALADIKNTGAPGRLAGACAGAAFLEFFIDKETPWAHLDIAGTGWVDSDRPCRPRGGTGFGVRLLDRFVEVYKAGA